MNTARIAPMAPPYSKPVRQAFAQIMRGAPPLLLFRTLAHNPRVLTRMIAGGLLDRGSISLRQRELMILRTTARCGAEYELGGCTSRRSERRRAGQCLSFTPPCMARHETRSGMPMNP